MMKKGHHPPSAEMVFEAISFLKEKDGSSFKAIKKFIASTYNVDVVKQGPLIKKYLKAAVTNGDLIKANGNCTSTCFKLPATRKEKKKSKSAATKNKKPKTSKKRVAAEDKEAFIKKKKSNNSSKTRENKKDVSNKNQNVIEKKKTPQVNGEISKAKYITANNKTQFESDLSKFKYFKKKRANRKQKGSKNNKKPEATVVKLPEVISVKKEIKVEPEYSSESNSVTKEGDSNKNQKVGGNKKRRKRNRRRSSNIKTFKYNSKTSRTLLITDTSGNGRESNIAVNIKIIHKAPKKLTLADFLNHQKENLSSSMTPSPKKTRSNKRY